MNETLKRKRSHGRLQGRLAQLEERLVCNQKAGGSNPPASTTLTRIKPISCPNLIDTGWISALIASLFGAGDEVEEILEEE